MQHLQCNLAAPFHSLHSCRPDSAGQRLSCSAQNTADAVLLTAAFLKHVAASTGEAAATAGPDTAPPTPLTATAFVDKDDQWNPDEGLGIYLIPPAATAATVKEPLPGSFEAKVSSPWDPDQDLFGLSNNFETDAEAEAVISRTTDAAVHGAPQVGEKKQPFTDSLYHNYMPTEGDPTVG